MSKPVIDVSRDAEALAQHAADFVLDTANQAIRERGRFTLALAGGSTPERAYTLLTEPGRKEKTDWSKWDLFFGDDRFVPHDDSRSNYAMAKRTLLDRIEGARVFPIATELATPELAAQQYQAALAAAFGIPISSAPPRFDLILLGMGDDGHTASLFPGKPAVRETVKWVTMCPPGVLPPPVDRVTFTFPTINAARQVVFLAAGGKKAAMLREVLHGNPSVDEKPAAGVRPTDGVLTWMIDEAAAQGLH